MNQPLELYEYVLWNDEGMGVIIHATGMISAHNLQGAADHAGEWCSHRIIKPKNAYISVRKWGFTAPLIYHDV